MKALLQKYDNLPWIEEKVKGIFWKPVVVGSLGATMIRWNKGVEFGPTQHAEREMFFFIKGKLEMTIKDDAGQRKEVVSEGWVLAMEPFVSHQGKVLEDSMAWQVRWPADRDMEDARKLGLLVSEAK